VLPLAANAAIITRTLNVTGSDPGGINTVYDLDIDDDGSNDFTFTANFDDSILGGNNSVTVKPFLGTTNSYVGTVGVLTEATPFPSQADALSNGGTYITTEGIIQRSVKVKKFPFLGYEMQGPWPENGSFAFLGVQFTHNGSTVKGFVELSATTREGDFFGPASVSVSAVDSPSTFTIRSVGFDNGAAVPEPSTLAMFALGAVGIAAVRARRKSA